MARPLNTIALKHRGIFRTYTPTLVIYHLSLFSQADFCQHATTRQPPHLGLSASHASEETPKPVLRNSTVAVRTTHR